MNFQRSHSSQPSSEAYSTKPRTGIQALADVGSEDGDDFSVIQAIGGPRGVVESMLPGALFVVLFLVTNDLKMTIMISAAWAAVQVLIRILQRQSVLGAVSGMLAIAVCLFWAWKSNEARNYYTFGFITNAIYAVLLLISLMAKVPGLGLLVEFVRSMPSSHFKQWLNGWRSDKALYNAYVKITWLWIVLFVVRLIVQLPLYSADEVGWLGTARLLMGIPLWALCIWISYLIVATPLHHHRYAEKLAAEREGERIELESLEEQSESSSATQSDAAYASRRSQKERNEPHDD